VLLPLALVPSMAMTIGSSRVEGQHRRLQVAGCTLQVHGRKEPATGALRFTTLDLTRKEFVHARGRPAAASRTAAQPVGRRTASFWKKSGKVFFTHAGFLI